MLLLSSAVIKKLLGSNGVTALKEPFRVLDNMLPELLSCPKFFTPLFCVSIQTTYVALAGVSLFELARCKTFRSMW